MVKRWPATRAPSSTTRLRSFLPGETKPILSEARSPDFEERVHHCGDQKLAAVVLLAVLRHRHVRPARPEMDGSAQRALASLRQTQPHLLGEAEQDGLL